jgi:hypothetical protein
LKKSEGVHSFIDNRMRRSSMIQFSGTEPVKPPNKEKMKKIMKLEPGFPVFREAVTAINRAAFGRLEWYFAFFPTV